MINTIIYGIKGGDKIKWINHKILTGSLVYATTGNVFFTVAAIAGSIFPDAIEGNPKTADSRIWRKQHRKKSHCLAAYMAAVLLVMALILVRPFLYDESFYGQALILLNWFLIGAVLHILQDALCDKSLYGGKHG